MTRRTAVFAVVGALSGAFGAYAHHNELLRPLAHVLGPWLLVAVVAAARQPARRAMVDCVVSLLAAVVAFYVGKDLIYGIRYPGSPFALNLTVLTLWCGLAVVGGIALGLAFHRIGSTGWPGAAATAAAAGLLIADGVREIGHRNESPVLLVFAVLAVLAVGLLAARGARQLALTAVLVLPMTLVGYVIVTAPDVLEDIAFRVL
ncbi:DUF6518 family protein [Pseudonocardia sp. TRM90224]|uniref:DUF6518 family protein n=1 Tax=Pseudonocardia sp. TRM90224 TaxID=2812678 RepID=UPI001E3FB04E|nr:DUF6518 family protein [Pseudonocardia sp. TRM90224]